MVSTKTGLDDLLVGHGLDVLRRLIDEAEPYAGVAELHALNEEVAYIRDPGLVVRLETMQVMSPRAFVEHAYADRIYHRRNGDKIEERSAAYEWRKWPGRIALERITYAPGEMQIVDGCLNTWEGWGVEPDYGDVTPWTQLLNHLFKDDPAARRWFEQWLAYPLQHPGAKIRTASALHGRNTGVGKSLVGYTMRRIYGDNFSEINEEHLHGNFNEWAVNKQFAMGEEITGGVKRGIADRLKNMITREELRLNIKYLPSYTVPDRVNYYFTSNHPDAFFLEDEDRRFFVHEIKAPPLEQDFYDRYGKWLDGEGPAALFDYFLSLDLSDFNPYGRAPMTASKREMIELGRSDLASWVAALREDPDTVLRIDNGKLPHALWSADDLLVVYDPEQRKRVTVNGMARELKRAGIPQAADGKPCRTAGGQHRLYAIRETDTWVRATPAKAGTRYDRERGPRNNVVSITGQRKKW